MTKVKLCGLSRESDIAAVNKLKPDLVGFVFAKKSKRYVSPEQAEHLKSLLAPGILAALGRERGTFRSPGDKPFAMYHSLTGESWMPGYFGLAFE